MQYAERRPDPRLAPWVECLWSLRGPADSGQPAQRILPDGCPELILHLGELGNTRSQDGQQGTARITLAGQLSRYFVLRAGARVDLLGVRFRPAGAARFLGPRLDDWTDQVLDLACLDADLERTLARALESEPDARPLAKSRAGLGSRVEACLVARLAQGGQAADWLAAHAAQRIVGSRGRLRVDDLARELGVGTRYLRRVFRPRVGLGPKELARILRFQSVFQAVESHPIETWADVALGAGYADQAHLNRDFRDLAGDTPPRILEQAGALTHAFTRAGRP